MEREYLAYKCIRCRKEFILITKEAFNHTGFVACPYCNSRKLEMGKQYDGINEAIKGGEIDKRNLD